MRHLGELDGRLSGAVPEGVVERQHAHLPVRGVHQPRLAASEGCAPEARQPIEVLLARVVKHVHALRTRDHHRVLVRQLHSGGNSSKRSTMLCPCSISLTLLKDTPPLTAWAMPPGWRG